MSLFKKKACCCDNTAKTEPCCTKKLGEITSVKVLGAGCTSCHKQYENAKVAVKELGIAVEVEYVTDMTKIMEYGVMSMPAIVVNEKVVSMGKIMKASDVRTLLQTLCK